MGKSLFSENIDYQKHLEHDKNPQRFLTEATSQNGWSLFYQYVEFHKLICLLIKILTGDVISKGGGGK